MTKIRVKEYLKNEKYYFIPIRVQSEYLAVSYDKYYDCFILQYFKENDNIIGKLEPNIHKRFILSNKDMEAIINTIVFIWNNQNTENFKIMEDALQKIEMQLLCKSIPQDRRWLYIKFKAQDMTYRSSFGAMLNREQCKQLYAVVRHIKIENNLI